MRFGYVSLAASRAGPFTVTVNLTEDSTSMTKSESVLGFRRAGDRVDSAAEPGPFVGTETPVSHHFLPFESPCPPSSPGSLPFSVFTSSSCLRPSDKSHRDSRGAILGRYSRFSSRLGRYLAIQSGESGSRSSSLHTLARAALTLPAQGPRGDFEDC